MRNVDRRGYPPRLAGTQLAQANGSLGTSQVGRAVTLLAPTDS
jgi:hypothetical protein